MFNPITACENGIYSYVSSSLNSGSFTSNVFTGLSNADTDLAPTVKIYCRDVQEVVFNTRNYAYDVEILVTEIAADNTVAGYDSLAGRVLGYFADSTQCVTALSQYCRVNNLGINFWQIQIVGMNSAHEGDVWVNQFNLKFVGALVPTS